MGNLKDAKNIASAIDSLDPLLGVDVAGNTFTNRTLLRLSI